MSSWIRQHSLQGQRALSPKKLRTHCQRFDVLSHCVSHQFSNQHRTVLFTEKIIIHSHQILSNLILHFYKTSCLTKVMLSFNLAISSVFETGNSLLLFDEMVAVKKKNPPFEFITPVCFFEFSIWFISDRKSWIIIALRCVIVMSVARSFLFWMREVVMAYYVTDLILFLWSCKDSCCSQMAMLWWNKRCMLLMKWDYEHGRKLQGHKSTILVRIFLWHSWSEAVKKLEMYSLFFEYEGADHG